LIKQGGAQHERGDRFVEEEPGRHVGIGMCEMRQQLEPDKRGDKTRHMREIDLPRPIARLVSQLLRRDTQ
jgi:hypothetical protein